MAVGIHRRRRLDHNKSHHGVSPEAVDPLKYAVFNQGAELNVDKGQHAQQCQNFKADSRHS